MQHLTATECGITALIYNLGVSATVHIQLLLMVFVPAARVMLTGFLSFTKWWWSLTVFLEILRRNTKTEKYATLRVFVSRADWQNDSKSTEFLGSFVWCVGGKQRIVQIKKGEITEQDINPNIFLYTNPTQMYQIIILSKLIWLLKKILQIILGETWIK